MSMKAVLQEGSGREILEMNYNRERGHEDAKDLIENSQNDGVPES